MSLTSLRIIRGRTLFFPNPDDHTGFSLFVAHNYKPGSLTVGLHELQLVSLHGSLRPVFEKTCATTQKKRKKSCFLDFGKKRKKCTYSFTGHNYWKSVPVSHQHQTSCSEMRTQETMQLRNMCDKPECSAMAQNGSHSGSRELNYSDHWAKYVNSFWRIANDFLRLFDTSFQKT